MPDDAVKADAAAGDGAGEQGHGRAERPTRHKARRRAAAEWSQPFWSFRLHHWYSPLVYLGFEELGVPVPEDGGDQELGSLSGSASCMHRTTFEKVKEALQKAGAVAPKSLEGARAKLHKALQPRANEMFFSPVLVLVEGLEDLAYITAYLGITKRLDEYRRLGCHIVPAECKSNIPTLLAIARLIRIPTFVVFDSDSNTEERHRP
jgi:hypothetical protein